MTSVCVQRFCSDSQVGVLEHNTIVVRAFIEHRAWLFTSIMIKKSDWMQSISSRHTSGIISNYKFVPSRYCAVSYQIFHLAQSLMPFSQWDFCTYQLVRTSLLIDHSQISSMNANIQKNVVLFVATKNNTGKRRASPIIQQHMIWTASRSSQISQICVFQNLHDWYKFSTLSPESLENFDSKNGSIMFTLGTYLTCYHQSIQMNFVIRTCSQLDKNDQGFHQSPLSAMK